MVSWRSTAWPVPSLAGAVPGRRRSATLSGMLRRAVTALWILLAGAAALMTGFAVAGPGGRAGAVPDVTSTTNCIGVPCATTTVATVPLTTVAPPTTTPQTAPPTTKAPVTQTRPPGPTIPRTTLPAPTTTATTLPSIGGNLPVTPSTVPFTTKQQSSHVNPVFAALSGAGLFVALVIVLVRFITSRPRD